MEEAITYAPEIFDLAKTLYENMQSKGDNKTAKQIHGPGNAIAGRSDEIKASQSSARTEAFNSNRDLSDTQPTDPFSNLDSSGGESTSSSGQGPSEIGMGGTVSPPAVPETGTAIKTDHVLITQHTIESNKFYYLAGSASPIAFLEANNIQKMVKYWPMTTGLEVKDASIEISNVYILDNKQDATTGQINTGLVQRGKICLFRVTNSNHNPFQICHISDVVRWWSANTDVNTPHGYYYRIGDYFSFDLCDWDESGTIGNRKMFPARGENFGFNKQIDGGNSVVIPPGNGAYEDWRNLAVYERAQLKQDRPGAYIDSSLLDQIPQVNDPMLEMPFARNSEAGVIGWTSGSLPTNLRERMIYVNTFGMTNPSGGMYQNAGVSGGAVNWTTVGGVVDTRWPVRIDMKLSSRFPPHIFGGDSPPIKLPVVTNTEGVLIDKRMEMAIHYQHPDSTSYYDFQEASHNFLVSCPLMPLMYANSDPLNAIVMTGGAPANVNLTAADIASVPLWPSKNNPLRQTGNMGERVNMWNHMGHSKHCKPQKHYFMCMQTIRDAENKIIPMAANFQLIHRMTTIQHMNNVFYADNSGYNGHQWRTCGQVRTHANNNKFVFAMRCHTV